jgi:hypothetical protein
MNGQKTTYFFDVEEICFHALNGHLLVVFDGLSLEHFREGSFTFLGYQTVLYTNN